MTFLSTIHLTWNLTLHVIRVRRRYLVIAHEVAKGTFLRIKFDLLQTNEIKQYLLNEFQAFFIKQL